MSDAQVSRTLVVKSPQQFYKIIKDNNLITNNLIPFLDRMELFLFGCPCESELNWEQSVNEYKKISKIDLGHVKSHIGCSSIEFYLDGTKLFDCV
jgi:hypothetical protein